mgnify:CR=1 FL=1
MIVIARIAALAGLALVIVPAGLYLGADVGKASMQSTMLAGTVLWFVAAPFWNGRPGG